MAKSKKGAPRKPAGTVAAELETPAHRRGEEQVVPPRDPSQRGVHEDDVSELRREGRKRLADFFVETKRAGRGKFGGMTEAEVREYAHQQFDRLDYVVPTSDLAEIIEKSLCVIWAVEADMSFVDARTSHHDSRPERIEVRADVEWSDSNEPEKIGTFKQTLFADRAHDYLLISAKLNQPDIVREFVPPLLEDGPTALTKTINDLIRNADPSEFGINTLSWLGNRVSHHLRRAVLLRELEAADWNMALVSERLRLGYGSAPTLRAIRELDLTAEYEAAKAAGKIKRGGAPRRPK